MIRAWFTFFTLLFSLLTVTAQEPPDDLFLTEHLQPVSPENIFRTPGYYNWGSSIIKGKDGRYHLFYARWKKTYSFTGWLVLSEIAHAVSKTPYGPWKYKETVLRGQGPGHWDAYTAHNPKIKYFDGKYYLYYISTNLGEDTLTHDRLLEIAHKGYRHPLWMVIRNRQRTGVAVASSLEGPWKRLDQPILEPSGPITRLTVNSAITKGPDGRYYLVVKGDKPGAQRFLRNQAIAVGETPTGPFVMQQEPVIDYIDTEDMSMWYDKERHRFYGVFHARGFIGLVTSADGIHWHKATRYVLMPKVVPLAGGDTLKPGRLERPFVYTENGEVKVLSLAAKKGDDSFCVFIPIKKNKMPLPNRAQLAEARWGGSESGTVPYPCRPTFPYPSVDATLYPKITKNGFAMLKHGDPDGPYWMPAMSDAPLRGYNGRHEWFWEPGDESHIFPLEKLMDMYYKSVGHNFTLILGITPATSGLIPTADVQRMKEFGAAIKKQYEYPLQSISEPQKISRVVLREDIRKGERVCKFVLEGMADGQWKLLFEGSCIGHKLIIPMEPVKVSRLQLKITGAVDEPEIAEFSVYGPSVTGDAGSEM